MQLWVLGEAVPPTGGGVAGLEFAVELVAEAVLDGAVLVALGVVGLVLGLVAEAEGVALLLVVLGWITIGGRWWPPFCQLLLPELCLPVREWPLVLADTA